MSVIKLEKRFNLYSYQYIYGNKTITFTRIY